MKPELLKARIEKVEAMRQGMELMHQGHIITEPLVTIYDFEEIEDAFRNLNERKPGLLKAVLLMDKPSKKNTDFLDEAD